MASDGRALDSHRNLVLPALLRRHASGIPYLIAWAPYIAIYQASNRWPLRTPIELTFGALDRAVPFVPGLLPIYVAYLPFFFWTVYRSRTDAEVNELFYATYLQLLFSLPFFLFFPVTMPRHLFYAAQSFGWADTFWRWFDGPNNCFPSLHSANCLLFIQFNWRRPWRWLHTGLGVAIIASTLLVKQHYFVDLIGGACVYLAARLAMAHVRIAGVR